eukprot:TRINITY_DN17037_c0_g1_i4.p1 TRINITY_DN17037_c0_g1~~TRINITY_DN17037_c0_g1_i4.p1  ORF type:complete len:196 (-),score=39.38 TRINITY_DN17037_c0_g1_i4:116-703(-)
MHHDTMPPPVLLSLLLATASSLTVPNLLGRFSDSFLLYRETKPLHLARGDPDFYRQSLPTISDMDTLIQAMLSVSESSTKPPTNGRDIKIVAATGGQTARVWLPPSRPHVSLQDTQEMFSRGFGVVINAASHRSDQVARLARGLHEAFGTRVSANLYLSPAHTQMLDPHMDWMEVFALQLYGTCLLYTSPSPRDS